MQCIQCSNTEPAVSVAARERETAKNKKEKQHRNTQIESSDSLRILPVYMMYHVTMYSDAISQNINERKKKRGEENNKSMQLNLQNEMKNCLFTQNKFPAIFAS